MSFSLINATINGGSSGTSGTVSPGWTLAAGHLVVVGVAVNSGTILSTPTVTDSAGNTYTLRAGLANSGSNGNGFWFFDSRIVTGGSGITITAGFSASTLWAVSALEYSFSGGSLGFDAASTGHLDAAGTTAVDAGPITLAGSGRLVLLGCSTSGTPTFAAGGGFTLETFLNTSGPAHQAVADLTPASGTVDGSISGGGTSWKWSAAQASYYESAAASPHFLPLLGCGN